MNPSQFLLALINAYGNKVQGRTLLQKIGFFVPLLAQLPINFGYHAYYYGPYSATIDGTLTQLKNLGFVEETSTGFGIMSGGFEICRYDYSLTDDGKKILAPFLNTKEYQAVESAVSKIRAAGDPNYMELSIAAKAYFILTSEGKPLSASELKREAKKFNWEVNEQSLSRAVKFLQAVQLAH